MSKRASVALASLVLVTLAGCGFVQDDAVGPIPDTSPRATVPPPPTDPATGSDDGSTPDPTAPGDPSEPSDSTVPAPTTTQIPDSQVAVSTTLPVVQLPTPFLPSVYPRSPVFCDAGADFFRSGNQLFDGDVDTERNPLALVSAFLSHWDQVILAAPLDVEAPISVLRTARVEFEPLAFEVATLEEFRMLAVRFFGEHEGLVAAMDEMTTWCGADPAGRGGPFE